MPLKFDKVFFEEIFTRNDPCAVHKIDAPNPIKAEVGMSTIGKYFSGIKNFVALAPK